MTKKIFFTLLILVITALTFYRYDWQPKQIRQKCAEKQMAQLKGVSFEDLNGTAAQASAAVLDINRFFYDICLRQNGLAK